MKKYLLNSAVITSPGTYNYWLVAPERAKRWSTPNKSIVSTIGYEQTAEALSQILGWEVPVNRKTITMFPEDEALVFRLVFKEGTSRIDPQDKGRLREEILAGNFELGLLKRIA